MSQFIVCPQKHIDNENCDKVSKQDVNITLPHTREDIVRNSSDNNTDFAANSEEFSLKIETVDTNEVELESEVSKLNLECFENVEKCCDEAIDVESVLILKQELNSNEVELEDEISKLNLECSNVAKDCDEVKDVENGTIEHPKTVELDNEVSKLNLERSEQVEKNCDEFEVSKLNLDFPENVENASGKILQNESNLRISVDVPIELAKIENTLSSSTELIFDSKVNDVAIIEAIRRNSLPEGGRIDLNKIIVNSTSVNFDNVSHVDRPPTLQSDRAKVAPNMHNISDVVRNVHGLFSIVKNAYKPMEKNIGEMMIATQKNLSSAKNGYLNMKQESKSHDIVENLSKYSTLNLSNENKDLDSGIFSKCDNLKSADKDNKNSDAKHSFNVKMNDVPNSEVGNNLNINSKRNFEYDLNKQNQLVDGIVKIDTFSIDEESIEPRHKDEKLVDAVGTAEITDDKRSLEGMEVLEATVLEQNAELDALRQALSQKDAVKRELEAKISNVS